MLWSCRRAGAASPPAIIHLLRHSELLQDLPTPAHMRGADDLTMRVYAAMPRKKRELIGQRTRVALAAAKARRRVLDGDRGYRPAKGPDSGAAALARRAAAEQAAHRLALEVATARAAGAFTNKALARPSRSGACRRRGGAGRSGPTRPWRVC